MSGLRYRARPIDLNRPMEIIRHEFEDDDIRMRAQGPLLATGMDEEEEREHHIKALVNAFKRRVHGVKENVADIPVPPVRVVPTWEAETDHHPIQETSTYFRYDVPISDVLDAMTEYDLDDEDAEFLHNVLNQRFPHDQLTEDILEMVIDKFEKASHGLKTIDEFDSQRAISLFAGERALKPEVLVAIQGYWLAKRKELDHSFIRRLVPPPNPDDPSPWIAFRPRADDDKRKKDRLNDKQSMAKMKSLRREMESARIIMELLRRRENLKREFWTNQRDLFYAAVEDIHKKSQLKKQRKLSAVEKKALAAQQRQLLKQQTLFERSNKKRKLPRDHAYDESGDDDDYADGVDDDDDDDDFEDSEAGATSQHKKETASAAKKRKKKRRDEDEDEDYVSPHEEKKRRQREYERKRAEQQKLQQQLLQLQHQQRQLQKLKELKAAKEQEEKSIYDDMPQLDLDLMQWRPQRQPVSTVVDWDYGDEESEDEDDEAAVANGVRGGARGLGRRGGYPLTVTPTGRPVISDAAKANRRLEQKTWVELPATQLADGRTCVCLVRRRVVKGGRVVFDRRRQWTNVRDRDAGVVGMGRFRNRLRNRVVSAVETTTGGASGAGGGMSLPRDGSSGGGGGGSGSGNGTSMNGCAQNTFKSGTHTSTTNGVNPSSSSSAFTHASTSASTSTSTSSSSSSSSSSPSSIFATSLSSPSLLKAPALHGQHNHRQMLRQQQNFASSVNGVPLSSYGSPFTPSPTTSTSSSSSSSSQPSSSFSSATTSVRPSHIVRPSTVATAAVRITSSQTPPLTSAGNASTTNTSAVNVVYNRLAHAEQAQAQHILQQSGRLPPKGQPLTVPLQQVQQQAWQPKGSSIVSSGGSTSYVTSSTSNPSLLLYNNNMSSATLAEAAARAAATTKGAIGNRKLGVSDDGRGGGGGHGRGSAIGYSNSAAVIGGASGDLLPTTATAAIPAMTSPNRRSLEDAASLAANLRNGSSFLQTPAFLPPSKIKVQLQQQQQQHQHQQVYALGASLKYAAAAAAASTSTPSPSSSSPSSVFISTPKAAAAAAATATAHHPTTFHSSSS